MIYDITQELFGGEVYPGDKRPEFTRIRSFDNGDMSTLTELSMNVHNATHIDAPIHKVRGGRAIDQIPLETCIGDCEVISHNDKERIRNTKCTRILLAGCESVDEETARLLVDKGVVFLAVEGQSVGTREVHVILLSANVVVLEGVRLAHVPTGEYFLSAAPLKLGGCDGAPCRAVLIER